MVMDYTPKVSDCLRRIRMYRRLAVMTLLLNLASYALSDQPYEPLGASSYTLFPDTSHRSTKLLSEFRAPHGNTIDLFKNKRVLLLQDLIVEVERRNPSLSAMQYAWHAAASRYPQATSLDDPMLSYGIAPGTIGQSDLDFGQRVELSQSFPWPGKRTLRGEITLSAAEVAQEDFEAVRQRLMQETKWQYFNYYLVFRAIEINEVHKSLQEEFRKIAETKYAVGTISRQDVLQAEIEHSHLIHRGITLERMRKTAVADINTLLNLMPDEPIPPPVVELALPTSRPDVEDLRALALNQRPEIQALAARLKGAKATVQLARKEYYPDFTVKGVYNSLWMRDEQRARIAIGINVPLGLERRGGAKREALARVEQLRAELAARVIEVAMEIQEACDRLIETEHIIHLYRTRLLPATKENLVLSRTGYGVGKIDSLTLISATKDLMSTKLEYHTELTAYHRHTANLERALGGPLPARNPRKWDD